MDIKPLHDRIIVRRLDEGEQSVGGIIVPDSAKEKPRGQVLAAGIGKANADGRRMPLEIKAPT
jgi:chaperonin GroES